MYDMENYICQVCRKFFYQKRYLTVHLKRIHNIEKHKNFTIKCDVCGKTFKNKQSESCHRLKFHREKLKKKIFCKEENCDKGFPFLSDLRSHLKESHNYDGLDRCEEIEFECFEDFVQWLATEERNTGSHFIPNRGSKHFSPNSRSYYACSRSGVYNSTSEGKRQMEAQGTKKIGFHCTSQIIVSMKEKSVSVKYYRQHYKHNDDIGHAFMPDEVQKTVAIMEEPNVLESEANRSSDNNGQTADQTEEVPMEIVKDDEATPARLGIKDFDDENEEILRLTVEEAHNYILSKVEVFLKDPEINELLNLNNQAETLNSKIQKQEKEVSDLTRLYGTMCRDQEKFLRHTGVIPKVETKTVGVSVNLPWLPETLSGVVNEDILNQTGSSNRVFMPPPTETSSKVPKKASNEPIECIDLTDEVDGPGSSKSASATTESKPKFIDTPSSSSAVSSSVTSSILTEAKPIIPIEKTLQHPAPLPAVPDGKDESKVPPKPRLKISVDKTGIVLQWDLPSEAKGLEIMGFEIFGYQEKNNVPISSALWKKIGSVEPLALPMSCTLTQFMEGFKYHFSIRTFCKDDNFGPFSDPASVTFMP